MAIKRITVSNFKSFKELDIELGKFNVLIGANASGKSNFIQLFKFLRDIANLGLDNANSWQGGVEYFRNVNIGSKQDFSLRVVFDHEVKITTPRKVEEERRIGFSVNEATYEFAMSFPEKGSAYNIVKDNVTFQCDFFKTENNLAGIKTMGQQPKLGKGTIAVSTSGGQFHYQLDTPAEVSLKEEDISLRFLSSQKTSTQQLLLEPTTSAPATFFWPRGSIFNDITIYDFDRKLPKSAIPSAGKRELEEDGNNLAIVLKALLEDKEKRRKMSNLLKDTLSFVEDLDVQEATDQSLILMLRESYSRNLNLPAFLMSEGTIYITALIVALYFEQKPIAIFEDLEKSLHPYLISKIMGMVKEASEKKQIMATSHSPEVVKCTDFEDLILISRDKEGFSQISRPSEKEGVKTFLENEIGIEELYVRDLLRA